MTARGRRFLRRPDGDVSSVVRTRPAPAQSPPHRAPRRDGTAHRAWTAQQFREAFPWDQAPQYLIHDRDLTFHAVTATAKALGIEVVRTAPRSPWQNAYVER